ncbi:MAG: ATP-dependent helicase UvrD/PcrA [Chloroflexota bacterium]|nr:ATP-dependent helicase UvrD/PcrA [Chloroflexota bacterium]
MFKPRPGQDEVIRYESGKMGIAAVPGSGKTHTLSYLAARLVAGEDLEEEQEVLIVTLVNAAVNNFSSRVAGFLREFDLLPGIGYRVRTLHGLAYDIIREEPEMAGLDNRFSIIDERAATDVLNVVVGNWKRTHPDFIRAYTAENQDPERLDKYWTDTLSSLASSFIKQAKDYELTPEMIRAALDKEQKSGEQFPLLEMGYSFYAAYQQALSYRGAVDFEDLIRLAYRVLRNNPEYLQRLRYRWPYILEDEAQDSSLIQEKLLSLLCGDNGNWVRVGDPNQAIFETFTTAEPRLLREFLEREDVLPSDLRYSGRSAPAIIELANYLNRWSQERHPVLELRDTLAPPYIQPTPPGDPQPNPPDVPDNIIIHNKDLTPDEETNRIAKDAGKWLAENPQGTLAILVPRNTRGAEVVKKLKDLNVPIIEQLRSSKATRDAAQVLAAILGFYANPTARGKLTNAILVIAAVHHGSDLVKAHSKGIRDLVKNVKAPEELLAPSAVLPPVQARDPQQLTPEDLFHQALHALRQWQGAVVLPIDQLVMTIAMHLFTEPADLALAYKLAVVMGGLAASNPGAQLPFFCEELNNIAGNRVQLYGFSVEETGFDPDAHKGEAVISTMHKAKGLEWDRVYLMSVNNYDFPSAQPQDNFMSEKWFVRDRLNLEAEMIAQLKALAAHDRLGLRRPEGQATLEARLDYAAERLRLLYVGITRARRELVITRNTGQRNDCTEAVPLAALRAYLEHNA